MLSLDNFQIAAICTGIIISLSVLLWYFVMHKRASLKRRIERSPTPPSMKQNRRKKGNKHKKKNKSKKRSNSIPNIPKVSKTKESNAKNKIMLKSVEKSKSADHIDTDADHKEESKADVINVNDVIDSNDGLILEEKDIEMETECKYNETEIKQSNADEKNSNTEIIQLLSSLNDQFDQLIVGINEINKTLQNGQNDLQHSIPSKQNNQSLNIIQTIQFVLYLPLRILFNIKAILIFVLALSISIYFYKDELNNEFGINIDKFGELVIDYYIYPQQTIDRYMMKCAENIKYIKEYNKDITQRLDVDIIENWRKYEIKYDEYSDAFNQKLFYSKENQDINIRQLVLIGVTGTGKSLFGNRLAGFDNDTDIDNNGYFIVSGDIESCTKNISKLIVYNLYSINISILDTPGIFDTDDKDIINQHNLIEYLKGSDGVNAFLLVLKKERLSKFIQSMLIQFQDKFGKQFWSHLIFVINFWSERDKQGWDKWKIKFVEKIRNDFGLNDTRKYPLSIVGLNNYGSYKLEIAQDLIPNIPDSRLNCDEFKSPFDSLRNETVTLYGKIEKLVMERTEKLKNRNKECIEIKHGLKSLRWFDGKIKYEQEARIDDIHKEMHVNCDSLTVNEIDNITEGLMMKSVFNDNDNKNIIKLKSDTIDYKQT